MRKNKDHPEITDIKNICDISPKSKTTKNVCEKIQQDKSIDNHFKKVTPHSVHHPE